MVRSDLTAPDPGQPRTMQRTNLFDVRPRTPADRELLIEVLDASAALWNQVNYERRQQFFAGNSVWDTTDWYDRYKDVLGAATTQQIIRKNASAWTSFLALNKQWHDGECEDQPSPPGYWGNESDGRARRTYIRHDQYTLRWGARSRLDIPVGTRLKDTYGLGHNERLRLEAVGDPAWSGDPGRLELVYDDVTDTFRAYQPVTVPDANQEGPLATETAALDVGANTLVAATTTTGLRLLYDGQSLFDRFHQTTERIAAAEAKLPEGQQTSTHIRRLYRRRTRRRNHAQDALVRDLVERLHAAGVADLYVGDLRDVLRTHWSATVNEKTHLFWAVGRFVTRLQCVSAEYGLDVTVRSEAYTTQLCPACGEREHTSRRGDSFRCETCGFEGHADLKASRVFLDRVTDAGQSTGPMARPVRLVWDDHVWRRQSMTPVGRVRPTETRTDRSTCDMRCVGKLAAGATCSEHAADGRTQSAVGW